MNIVEEKFSDRGISRPGGWKVYRKDDALEFIRECQNFSITVLGIDGFKYFPETDGVQPFQEHSITFSSSHNVKTDFDPYKASMLFLESRPDDLYFEIVCGEKV